MDCKIKLCWYDIGEYEWNDRAAGFKETAMKTLGVDKYLFVTFGFMLLLAGCVSTGENSPESAERITIVPEETDAVLANPGMGWETFGRPADKDNNLPDWIISTIHYSRWGWGYWSRSRVRSIMNSWIRFSPKRAPRARNWRFA